jgi:hypothetical protein
VGWFVAGGGQGARTADSRSQGLDIRWRRAARTTPRR